jgi:hypothetical protein
MAKVTGGGIFREGVFSAGHRWPFFPTIKAAGEQASDHAAIFADLAIA